MFFTNLTPHTLNIHEGNNVVTLPPNGKSLRVDGKPTPVGTHGGVTLYRTTWGELEMVDNATKEVTVGLPPVVEGTIYIVSAACADKLKAAGRTDFASPGVMVRDDKGVVIGCKGINLI